MGTAISINIIRMTTGNISAMSGLMLSQFEKPGSDIKMTVDEGSWFGKMVIKFYT